MEGGAPSRAPGEGFRSAPRDALWLLLMSAAVRLALSLGTDITYDEAYYWTWSRALGLGYFDHPPMVAWLIRLLGVRGCALACGIATIALVQGLAADLSGRAETGWRAAALWSVLPASVLSGVFATPDAPLMPFWVGALWALHRRRWTLAGALCGLAMLSKYTGALLLVPAAIAWFQARARPRAFLSGAAAALAVFTPALVWNAAHGWASFRFQLGHGLHGLMGAPAAASAGYRLLEFAGGQLAVGGLLLPLGLWWAARAKSAPLWIRAAFLAPMAAFGAASLLARSEPNWALAAYVAPCAWVAADRRWPGRAAALLGAAVCLAGLLHLTFPVLRFPRDAALARTHGWRELKDLGADGARLVYAPNFGLASEVAFQARLPVAIAGASRLTQFDFWREPPLEDGGDALYISEGGEPPPEKLTRAFRSVEGPAVLETSYRGHRVHAFSLWRLRGRQAPPDRERPPIEPLKPP
ncbi:MAG TPA: glycosyltransferase family 39 protein [Myxococcaceae bacterium]|jgi:4-amino-4-deoxy-L-arabinose transferase-like glycosyltransferase